MTRDPSEFGVLLRTLREKAGLTQDELAERAGLTGQAVSALERGHRRRPYPNTIRALAAALGVDDSARLALIAASGRVREPASSPTVGRGATLAPPPTRLIGRQQNVDDLTRLLVTDRHRLVTLTGPGGVGKTRLALEVATVVRSAFSHGATVVTLAPLADSDAVISAIGYALGLREAGEYGWRSLLRDYLRERHVLVVLDNCEHVLAAAPELADLLADCGKLSFLATSRAPLRVRGERIYQVEPLAVPADDQPATLEELLGSPAGQLFVERASESSGRELSDRDAPAIAAICRRLEGLPLALELMAGWVRLLPPPVLLTRLENELLLHADGPRDLPARQRTLAATLDWSYNLLDPPEQAVLRRLSVFIGGFTLAAAEAVTPGVDVGASVVIELLARLVDHSLVVADADSRSETPRYRLLEPVRQYAAELLETSHETGMVREQHAAFLTNLASEARLELKRGDQVAWLKRVADEHNNIRAAIHWLLERGEIERVAQIGWGLFLFWITRGLTDDALQWMERALTLGTTISRTAHSRLLLVVGALAFER